MRGTGQILEKIRLKRREMIEKLSFEDTICALATPVGEGGIGIIKISGPDALNIAKKLFRHDPPIDHFVSHRLYYGLIADPENDTVLDEVLLSYMQAPRTYTREDVVEINCHSGPIVYKRILELVMDAGARLAEPGEFTKRAFLNGRIDLTQAEAIIDLIKTRSDRGVELAAQHLRGKFHDKIEEWRSTLIDILARVEACIDFPEDMEEELESEEVIESIRRGIIGPIQEALSNYDSGRILREGLKMVIVGKPNVGKSSLLNALLKEDRAIVSEIPGTTRDTIEESFSLKGIPIHIIDTAGLRAPGDKVEALGITRAKDRLAEADFVLFVIDRSVPLEKEDTEIFEEVKSKEGLIVLNKIDLPERTREEELREHFEKFPVVPVSVRTEKGLDKLEEEIFERIIKARIDYDRSMLAPNLRHKKCLELAVEYLNNAIDLLRKDESPELIAFELKQALDKLSEIVGENVGEDILDHIFSQFCIGK